ncbi:hypothetical protein MNBD_PLANCTO02-2053 [hydrothermal vent metagenome]|uniref:Methyltransferase domain-containing protein n=1 Tax=hydrothermal vent metagenome TaxID=652676 RepID=A0A3B1D151_9ZZZZ
MKSLTENLSLLRWAVHYEGFPFTVFRIAVKATSLVGARGTRSEWFQQLTEGRFDKRFNVETSGLMKPDEMQIPDDRLEHTVEYSPTSANRFGWLLSNLPVDLSQYTFIDFGSGKGRALLMASEFPFKQVVGIEFARELHETALKNIQSFRSRKRQCNSVQSFNQDATEFQFPDDPLVLFFFNPFSAEILKQVLNNLQSSLDKTPRDVIALYYNPLHANVFQESPLFSKPDFCPNPGAGWELYTTSSF